MVYYPLHKMLIVGSSPQKGQLTNSIQCTFHMLLVSFKHFFRVGEGVPGILIQGGNNLCILLKMLAPPPHSCTPK